MRQVNRSRKIVPTLLIASILIVVVIMLAGYLAFLSTVRNMFLPPLHAAIWREDEAVARNILANDRSMVNTPANRTWGNALDGATPLMLAAARGNETLIRLLLEHGADALQKNSMGHTAYDFGKLFGHDMQLLKHHD